MNFPSRNQIFQDDAGELRTAYTTNSSGAEITAQRYMFGYDAAWNMTKRTNNASVSTYTINNLNQNTTSYSYDSNGNPSSNGSGVTYTFDDENRLITAVTTISGANYVKTEFRYDARGRLRTKEEYSWNAGAWTITASVRYIYDGMLVVQERNSSNAPQVTYTRGPDLSGTLQGAGGIGGMLARTTGYSSVTGAWSTHQFYHADANGNITYLMSSAQALAASYRYDPFGRTITSSGGSASANTYRFSSKELHFGSAPFYYYGYRFYDPNTQRWLNRDPMAERAGLNLYQFCFNAPPTYVDPNGHNAIAIEIIAVSFGLSVKACLRSPPCLAAVAAAIGTAAGHVINICRAKEKDETPCFFTGNVVEVVGGLPECEYVCWGQGEKIYRGPGPDGCKARIKKGDPSEPLPDGPWIPLT